MNDTPDPSDIPELQRLPGVGHLLALTDEDGRPASIVRRKEGHLEVHHDGKVIVFEPAEALALGALASGHFLMSPELFERTADVLGGIEFDWVKVPKGSWAAGRTIEDLAVRRRTGISIVAILRGSLPVVSPDPKEEILVGDDLVIVCRPGNRETFERFLAEAP